MMKKELFWDALVWIGILLILGWAFLKAIGVISSPVWVEVIPYFGGGVSILGITCGVSYKLGKIMSEIKQTQEKVDRIVNIEERFSKLEHEHNLAMNGKLEVKHK